MPDDPKKSRSETEQDDFHTRMNDAMATTQKKKLLGMIKHQSTQGNTTDKMQSVDDKEKAYQERMKKQGMDVNPPKKKVTVKVKNKSLNERSGTVHSPKTVLGIKIKKD